MNDNYIGSREQINTEHDSWVDFFRECRLIPRFESAESYFDTGMKKSINNLIDRLDVSFAKPPDIFWTIVLWSCYKDCEVLCWLGVCKGYQK